MPRLSPLSLVPTLAHAAHADGAASHFLRWIGHFHPPLTAFPIAMLVGAAAAEALRMRTHAAWLDGATRWCVLVGAATAVLAAPLGWAFAAGRGGSWVLETHRWLGTAMAVVAVVVLVLSERRYRGGAAAGSGETGTTLFRAALFVAAPLVMATGFFGGAMVYGLRAYLWNSAGQEHVEPVGQGDNASAGASTRPTTGAAATPVTVKMVENFKFEPATITVPVGGTVRWMNASSDTHTASNEAASASDPANVSAPGGAARFNSGNIEPGGTFEQRFAVPGTYKYVCEPHEEMGMKGQIIVTPGQ